MIAATDPLAVFGAMGVFFSLLLVGGAAWAVFRTNTNKASIEIMVVRNQELRDDNETLRSDVHRLEGRVQVLQDGLAKDLARSIKAELRSLVDELRRESP